eukprot:gene9164-9331_t
MTPGAADSLRAQQAAAGWEQIFILFNLTAKQIAGPWWAFSTRRLGAAQTSCTTPLSGFELPSQPPGPPGPPSLPGAQLPSSTSTSTSKSPQPPTSTTLSGAEKPKPPLALPVEAYTTAPAAVWVEFDVSGTYKPLTLSIVRGTGPRNGTLGTVDQRGQRVRYTPDFTYCSITGRPDVFEYMVTDTKGKTSKAKAKVFVDCPDAVTTEDQFATTEINTPIDITTPVSGGVRPYKFNITVFPLGGVITQIIPTPYDVTFSYQPYPNYCSIDGFADYFEFQVSERYGTVAVGAIEVTVNCPPPPIVAPELLFNMSPGGTLDIDLQVEGTPPFRFDLIGPPLNGNLTNITDSGKNPPYAETQTFETPAQVPLLQQLIVISSAPLFFDISLFPQYGIIDSVDELGQSLYTPDFDFCSQQDTLDNWGFDVTDLYGQSTFALVFIKVVCPPAPQPKDTVVRLVGKANLIINLTLPIVGGTQPFYLEVSSDPLNAFLGGLDMAPDGKNAMTTFQPVDGYCNVEDNVPDPFNWVVYDPFSQFGEATCTTYVKCPEAPTAKDQFVTMNAGTSRLIRLQVTGQPPLEWLVYSPPASGELSEIYPNNTVVYTPFPDFCSINDEPDFMFFTVADTFTQSADGSVTITVTCPPEPQADDSEANILTSELFVNIKPVVKPVNGKYVFDIDEDPASAKVEWDDKLKVFVYTIKNPPCKLGSTDSFTFSVTDIFGQSTSYGQITVFCVDG